MTKDKEIIKKQEELITILLSRELKREGCYDFKIREIDDQLSSLKAEAEEEVSKWILVSDEVPPEKESVLCYNGFRIFETSWHEWTNHNLEWFKKTWTYWMPLPQKPTETI